MSIIKLLTSSVGRKILMAITGLLLSFFMAFHLFGNLFLFVGEAAFNGYVEKLHKLGFLIRIAEFFLVLFVFSHAYSGILLWIKNRKAKKVVSSYSKENTPGAAKYAAFTGSIVFIFLATHWSTFWYKFNFDLRGMSYYYVVTESQVGFGSPLVSIFYIIAIALLGYHLKHGITSAGQTLGIIGTKYEKTYNNIAAIFWFWIPLGFISIPVWFGFLVRII
jgi:succinate dehydrogenase / fumarate reductase cytochrome b subunit|tara:strand:+ start:7550 stop:8209 length:660 start_codon:yes stop_codon:yes gene_type:complete